MLGSGADIGYSDDEPHVVHVKEDLDAGEGDVKGGGAVVIRPRRRPRCGRRRFRCQALISESLGAGILSKELIDTVHGVGETGRRISTCRRRVVVGDSCRDTVVGIVQVEAVPLGNEMGVMLKGLTGGVGPSDVVESFLGDPIRDSEVPGWGVPGDTGFEIKDGGAVTEVEGPEVDLEFGVVNMGNLDEGETYIELKSLKQKMTYGVRPVG